MLPPELIKVIAQHVKHATPQNGKLEDEKGAREDQANLLRMIRVSKAFKSQASSLLLEDSFVVSPNGMSYKLRADPAAFARVARMRFAYHEPSDTDLYGALLSADCGRWILLRPKSAPDDDEVSDRILCGAAQSAAWGELARQLMVLQRDGPTPLKSLKRVVMGVGYSPWGSIYAEGEFQILASPDHVAMNHATSLATSMLRVGARHYCQREAFGSLALPCVNILCAQAPETITYHMHPDYFGRYPFLDERGPPIVLGTVNRYIFSRVRSDSLRPDSPGHESVSTEELARPVLDMLRRTEVYRLPGGPRFDGLPDFSHTMLELYGYLDEFSALIVQLKLDFARRPHQPKVFLKSVRDAKPCPACDLDPKKAGVHGA